MEKILKIQMLMFIILALVLIHWYIIIVMHPEFQNTQRSLFVNVKNNEIKTQRLKNYLNKSRELFDSVCSLAISGGPNVSFAVANYLMYPGKMFYNPLPKDCFDFVRHLQPLMKVTNLELSFPIAFSILVYRDPLQTIRLLRAIWRPQNYYCIHVDTSSSFDVLIYLMNRVKCLSNVIFAPRMVDVVWGRFSVLEADLICMEALYNHSKKWKYFINLTGQEFPLRTNYELVRILQLYAGGNDIYGQRYGLDTKRLKKIGPPPHGIIPTKGPVHMVASRGFVDYIFRNQTAKDFLEWVKNMTIPDETYFTSLNNNPHLQIPGSFKGKHDKRHIHNFYLDSRVRYKLFTYNKQLPKCNGMKRHSVCIFGVEDLPRLTKAPHLFANKFSYSYQTFAYDCLESWIFGKIEAEKKGHLNFDVSPYKNIYFLNNCYCKKQKI